MKIHVDQIKDKVIDLTATEEVTQFPILGELQESGASVFIDPLRIHLTVAREYDHIRAHGQVSTALRLGCSRCLTEFTHDVDASFTAIYMPKVAGVEQDEEVELSEEELISVIYEGDEIEFDQEIAEQVVAEIPIKPLCREDCRGLCPMCGADRNETVCECRTDQFTSKFGALKNFKPDK